MLLFEFLIIAVIVVMAVLSEKNKQRNKCKQNFSKNANHLASNFPYVTQACLLTPNEKQFWHVLAEVCRDEYLLACKPRVADILDTNPFDRIAFNRISQMHFDFVLCNKNTTRPLLVIELDDSTHGSPNAQGRDAVKDMACRAATLPILRVPVQSGYNLQYLQKRIAETVAPSSTL